MSLWVSFVVILAEGLLAAGLLAALYLRRLTWQACLRRACWRQQHPPAAPKLARRGAQAGDGGSCAVVSVGRRQHFGARLLRVRAAGGSTSGLVCFGAVGARRVFSAFVFLAQGGCGLSVVGVLPSYVGLFADVGQPLPTSLVAEPP